MEFSDSCTFNVSPTGLSVGHELFMQYRLNEAVGRPFDSTVNGAQSLPQ
jgi:hypothetical protein